MVDYFYHMTLRLIGNLISGVKKRFCQYVRDVAIHILGRALLKFKFSKKKVTSSSLRMKQVLNSR